MPIIPETLKALRESLGLSQQRLADRSEEIEGARVSKRTIARIESGEIRPERVRAHTLESLAKALEVKPDDLCKHKSAWSDADWKERGYTPLKLTISNEVRNNFRRVARHYGVKTRDLIHAAPWMFTLLAEMSLAERRERLEAARCAWKEALDRMPAHLPQSWPARHYLEDAQCIEQDSLIDRDIFGYGLLDTDGGAGGFDPDETNLFVDFLKRAASRLDRSAIDPEHLEHFGGGCIPGWPVFETWLTDLTGDDEWARFAIENVKGIVDAIPQNLKGEEKTKERVQWLIEQIPAEMKALEEERRAKLEATFAEFQL
ncbi:MAG: helix-turn-helix domain-containing protein [Rhodobacteraceae bacterium]|nr:helix-turn-helix domain-containing protein [Paracoccaceae bacterium]